MSEQYAGLSGTSHAASASDTDDLQRLTESFHLNLTALGLLAFLVGLFIVHAAIGLALEPSHSDIMKRKPRDPKESMPSRALMIYTLGIAAAIVAGTLGMYILTLQSNPDVSYARTVAFVGLGFALINLTVDMIYLFIDPRMRRK